jgi:subtilisin family serine protease
MTLPQLPPASQSHRSALRRSRGGSHETQPRGDIAAFARMFPWLSGILLAGVIVMTVGPSASAGVDPDPSCTPTLVRPPPSGLVPGQYIVTLDSHVQARDLQRFGITMGPGSQSALNGHRIDLASFSTAIEDELRRRGRQVFGSFRHAAIGFSAELTEAERAALEAVPGIEVIPDQYISVHSKIMSQGDTPPTMPTPLGLDRIDQRFGLDGAYSTRRKGAGVDVYVIDSGIRPYHDQFRTGEGTRVRYEIGQGGFSAVPGCPTSGDYLGHGTHVAGIVGGNTTGVAPQVTLHSVRVFGEWPTTQASWVASAVDWVTGEHVKAPGRPAVANMSLGARGGSIDIHADRPDALTRLNKFIDAAIRSGVVFVISAGNDGGLACDVSPAKVPDAITVGAIDSTVDARPNWSNQGRCVDVFAPGVQIWSADYLNNSTTPKDGTSMAAPHVAGVVALILEAHYPLSAIAVRDKVLAAATTRNQFPKWRICNITGASPNTLLHWGSGSEDGIKDGSSVTSRLIPCDGSRAYRGELPH